MRVSVTRVFLSACVAYLLTVPSHADIQRGLKSTSPAVREVQRGKFHLLTIGINGYRHWPALQTAVNDAQATEAILKRDYGFDVVHAIYDRRATRSTIIKTFRQLVDMLEEHDSLLIFYSGHGHLDDMTQTGAGAPVDATLDDDGTWINNAQIKRFIRAMKARHVLLVSDSCFSGDFFKVMRGAPRISDDDYAAKAFRKASRQAITSGGVEPVTDSGFGGHSVFTYFMLKELKESTADYLVPSDLFARIKGGVAANARQQPACGSLYDTGGEVGGEFVLFRVTADEATALDAIVAEERVAVASAPVKPATPSYIVLEITPAMAAGKVKAYVDRRRVDPTRPIEVSPGVYHSVKVKAKGYRDYTEKWRVSEGQTGLVRVRLIEQLDDALRVIW